MATTARKRLTNLTFRADGHFAHLRGHWATLAGTARLLLRMQGRVDARMAGRMAVLRGGDLNEPANPRQRWSGPQNNAQ